MMMSDLAQDAMRLREAAENLNEPMMAVIEHSGLDITKSAIRDVLQDTYKGKDLIQRLSFADRMINDWVEWLRGVQSDIQETATQIEQSGGGGPFG
jgi:hypothetical protein